MEAAHNTLDRNQWDRLRHQALQGSEIVDNTARLCVMNLYLHGIGANGAQGSDGSATDFAKHPGRRASEPQASIAHARPTTDGRSPIHVADSLASHPGQYFDMVLTNPPFGKKSSVSL